MNPSSRRIAALFAAIFALAALPVLAGTTGAIVGVASDASGGVMPGVTVEATSPAIQGTKVAVTGGDGVYRFQFLTPGTYRVKATLASFKTVEKSNIAVGLDDSIKIDFKLEPAVGAEVTITDEAPLIDQRSAKGGANFGEELFESLPVQRDYTSVVALTPGAGTDTADRTTFYGSTGPENSYIIDGVNTTNIGFGTQGKNLNFDFIKEVEVKSSGYEAEFGRATGGIINVITKNGGNEFTGDGFGYWSGKSLSSAACETCESRTGSKGGYDEYDFGGDLGGYVMKDKLWFFTAANPTYKDEFEITPAEAIPSSLNHYLPRPPSQNFTADATKRLYLAGKATWNINAANNAVFSAFGDPETVAGINPLGDAKTDSDTKRGGIDYTAKVNSVLNPSLYFDTQASLHQEKSHIIPSDGDFDSPSFTHRLTGVTRNGFGRWQKNDLSRWAMRGNLTAFAGEHELKFGADFENNIYDAKQGFTGGGSWNYRNATNIRRTFYFQDYDAAGNPNIVDTFQARTTTFNMAAFVQDKWAIRPNLVLSAGLRWDKQTVNDYQGITRIRLNGNLGPRLGLTWDPTNKGKWKVFASAGRFFEAIPLDLNNRALGAEGTGLEFRNRLPSSLDPNATFSRNDIGTCCTSNGIALLGGTITGVDPDLKGQHLDELAAGFEYELAPKLAIGMKGIYRKVGDVIEDLSADDGHTYFIGNPGQNAGTTGIGANGELVAFPIPERTFKGIEFTVNKRLSNRWQLYGSYLWSKLEGNYEGLFTSANGQLDPNITSAFDIPTLLPNRYGPLPQDRRHTVKLDGSYEMPFKLSIGTSLRFTSGAPLNTLGSHPVYGGDEAFMLPRGGVFSQDIVDRLWAATYPGEPVPQAISRTPSLWSVDVNLQYPIRLGATTLKLYLDVFNVFNFQRATEFTETFTLDSTDVSTLEGLSQEAIAFDGANPRFEPYADYLRADEFQKPLRARFGAKLSF